MPVSSTPGSHAYRGQTPRTRPMFGPPGFTYVYFTYGNHWMLRLVTGAVGEAEAVLVRAGEVVAGEDLVRTAPPRARARLDPRSGRLAQALAVTGADTGRDFCRPRGRAGRAPVPAGAAPLSCARGPGSVSVVRAATARPSRGGSGSRASRVSAYRPARRRATGPA